MKMLTKVVICPTKAVNFTTYRCDDHRHVTSLLIILYIERSSAMEKWQEALALISLRENELQESYEKVSKIKTNVFNLENELKEQNNFLDNEKDNVRELQHHIDCEENTYRQSWT